MVKEVRFGSEFTMFRCEICEVDYTSKRIAEKCEEEHSQSD